MVKKVALLLLLIIAIPIINSEIYGDTFKTDESVNEKIIRMYIIQYFHL